MTRLLRARVHGEAGVYSVLYALLVLVLVGLGALVVDLATLREERRTSRLGTDAGATAGAVLLNPALGIQPQPACAQAWSYLKTNLGATGSAPCAGFPMTLVGSCPSSATVVTGTLGPYSVKITWPVPDSDPLMTNPTVQGGFTQSIDPLVDGDTAADPRVPCSRLGVTVTRLRKSTFAGIFGVGSSPVVSSSVARGIPKDGNPPTIAALNVLEKHNCDAVVTSGQGFIQINATPPFPGIINVESDGHPSGGSSTCPSSKPYVIDPLNNPNNYIRANGVAADGVSQDPGKGFIQQWALSPAGNNAQAFAPLVPSVISPKPTPLYSTFGSKPVTDRYQTYIDLLVSKMQTGTPPLPYPNAQAPWNTTPFQTLPGPAVPAFKCTTTSSDAPIVVPAGNWYINCPPSSPNGIGLTIGSTVVFQGGTIVLDGGIELKQAAGCMVVNVTETPAACPPTNPMAPTGDAIIYMRSGQFIKGSQSQIFMPQTFTYIRDGLISMGAGSGALDWSRPDAIGCTTGDLDCKYSKFGGLVLWSEGSADHELGGQASLVLKGVLFTPNTRFFYTGQTTQNQTQAQFWTREIEVKGQSGLIMAPDPNDAVPSPTSGVALIR